jgi:phi13 family phage major tail protein
MSNKIRYGLKNVHYAVITEGENDTISYGTPVKISGAVSLTLDPQGDQVKFYADDMEYYSEYTNNGYSGTLEMALIPDDFKKDVLGYKEDANGVLFEDANAIAKNFALLFEFSGDKNAIRHVVYNVTSSRPSVSGDTKGETKNVQTESMSISAAPAKDTGLVKGKAEPSQTVYNDWYEQVYTFTEEA